MTSRARPAVAVVALAVLALVTGCGSGGGGGSHQTEAVATATTEPTPHATAAAPTATATVSNVQPITVDAGPTGDYTNGLFTSIVVCAPNDDAHCQTIDGVLVDTGSVGLRLAASVVSVSLPREDAANGDAIAECVPFLDSVTWGTVRTADVKLAGETASAIPIQLIGDPQEPTVPASCTSSGLPVADTVATLHTNGILGVGVFREDCGVVCESTGTDNPGLYFACSAGGCTQTAQPRAGQLQNPVAHFADDAQGVVVELPAISASGAAHVDGSLIFGIGTQANNAPAGETVLTLSANGTFRTLFDGLSVSPSFIDTGSNGIFFLDAAQTGIPTCTGSHGFYCPPSAETLTATQQGAHGESRSATFTVGNADMLFNANPDAVAFDDVAGPSPGVFDFGLPTFYGHRVFIGIEGENTALGVGPYVAY